MTVFVLGKGHDTVKKLVTALALCPQKSTQRPRVIAQRQVSDRGLRLASHSETLSQRQNNPERQNKIQ